jgi:hypothetical protein
VFLFFVYLDDRVCLLLCLNVCIVLSLSPCRLLDGGAVRKALELHRGDGACTQNTDTHLDMIVLPQSELL